MSTREEFAFDVLAELGIATEFASVSAEDQSRVLRKLDQIASELTRKGFELQTGDNVDIDAQYEKPLIDALALSLARQFGGQADPVALDAAMMSLRGALAKPVTGYPAEIETF